MKSKFLPYGIALIFSALAGLTPLLLGINIVPVGEGPDELAHIDYSFFKFTKPDVQIQLENGFYYPAVTPTGEGNQPPLAYILNARVLGMTLDPAKVGAFPDYQAGIQFSSEGFTMGGLNSCPYRKDPHRQDASTRKFYEAYLSLRMLSSALLGIAVFCAFVLGGLAFPIAVSRGLAFGLLVASIPNNIWRTIFVNNDNLTATLCAATFCIAAWIVLQKRSFPIIATVCGTILAACAFLSKLNGSLAIISIIAALVLSQSISLGKKLILAPLAVVLFIFAIAPYAADAVRTNGSLLATDFTVRNYSFLYRPSTLFSRLTDWSFHFDLIRNFWIEFDRIPPVAEPALTWPGKLWYGLLILAVLGACACVRNLFRRTNNTAADSRLYLLALACCGFSYLGVVDYSTMFPLPSGRYLHVAVLPICLLIFGGIAALVKVICRTDLRTDRTLLVGGVLCFLGCHVATYDYLNRKYFDCREDTQFNVDGGATVAAGDQDGDGIDEILIFQRIRNQVYTAKFNGSNYVIDPSRTRSVGIPSSKIFSGDVDGDGKSELIIWRWHNGEWLTVPAQQVTTHDKSLSPWSDTALKPTLYYMPADDTEFAGVEDLDGDGRDEFVSVSKVRRGIRSHFHTQDSNSYTDYQIASQPTGFIGLARGGLPQLLIYNDEGAAAFDLDSKSVTRTADLKRGLKVAVDADGNGWDEILNWPRDSACFETYTWGGSGELGSDRSKCVQRYGKPVKLSRHHQLFSVRTRQSVDFPLQRLPALFDRRTGEVMLIPLPFTTRSNSHNVEGVVSELGFMGPGRSSKNFAH